ncbi:asparagine synthase (glutamine-hydrolyzing) [Cyanobacteria bacterium FACHB-502]|nr:asparagine synthase (glutamine-hydrolyzing) [Cyanobacteria bacterium FACHB-502]
MPLDTNRLEPVLPWLKFRGPDDRGIWSDRHIQLGHTRLAILDLSPLGHQPMSFQDGRYWITFNGEIYNYLELRAELVQAGYQFTSKSDTEVLLAAYAHWGTGCLEKLRGMFAFAIWDRKINQLFLARDRFGEKPLYYWIDQGTFYFASELKALLALLPHTPELDPIAVDLYFHYQYVPEPLTPLQGVRKLPAAHFMTLQLDSWKVDLSQYWSLAQIQPLEGNISELIRAELERAIDLSLRSDVPVGIALSGGLDSGTIVALAAPKYKKVLHAFSVGYPGSPPCDEREQARSLANQLGLPFHDVELHTEALVEFFPELMKALDDPIADIAAYGHFAVMRLAAEQGIKVMLSGVGGDELFWGYDWMIEAHHMTQQKQRQNSISAIATTLGKLAHIPIYEKFAVTPKLPKPVRSLLVQGLNAHLIDNEHPNQFVFYNLRQDFRSPWYHRRSLYSQEFLTQLPERNPFHPSVGNDAAWSDITTHLCQVLFNTWLVSNCLALGDRTSMASSLEVRLPLLDYKLAETVIGLQKQYPNEFRNKKAWLKQAVQDILPAEILNRPKRGFEPPYASWIQALLDRYKDSVVSGSLVQSSFLNRNYLVKLFQKPYNNYALVYRVLVLDTWLQNIR